MFKKILSLIWWFGELFELADGIVGDTDERLLLSNELVKFELSPPLIDCCDFVNTGGVRCTVPVQFRFIALINGGGI